MDFELTDETVRAIGVEPLSPNVLTAATDYIRTMGYDTVPRRLIAHMLRWRPRV